MRPGSLFPISLYPAESHTFPVGQPLALQLKEKEILNLRQRPAATFECSLENEAQPAANRPGRVRQHKPPTVGQRNRQIPLREHVP